jgi:NAD-dependent deacetylase
MDSRIIQALSSASRVVVFTGAGVSAESWIPTFRDKQTGLWENFDAAELATPSAFERDRLSCGPDSLYALYRRALLA